MDCLAHKCLIKFLSSPLFLGVILCAFLYECPCHAQTKRVTKADVSVKYTPDPTINPKKFAQDSYRMIESMGNYQPLPDDPKMRLKVMRDQIYQVLEDTDIPNLRKIKSVFIKRQITRYNEARHAIEILRDQGGATNLARANRIEKTLQDDPIATDNAPHVSEVLALLQESEPEIKDFLLEIAPELTVGQLDHIFEFEETDVAGHDIGKPFPDPNILKVAEQVEEMGCSAFITGRITFHELSSAVMIDFLGQLNHIPPKTIEALIRNILGHNEGSGLADVWWNLIGHPERVFGKYPLPNTLFALILTLVDRGAQATLGPTGGVLKIANQMERAGRPFDKEFLAAAMLSNAEGTQRQIREVSLRLGISPDESRFISRLLKKQQSAIDAFKAIDWDQGNKSGTIFGKHFENKKQFFEIINALNPPH